MNNKRAKKLRRQAVKEVGKEAVKFLLDDGSVKWNGWVRRYRDLKREWKKGDKNEYLNRG